jgi:site-specific DNA recombinase
MEDKKAVGIWIRVSTEDQARGESPEHHEKRARLYAEAKGWDVLEAYHLEGVSGKAVMHHSETKRMLQDIKAGKIQGLIFSKLARLARNTIELLEFSDIFKRHNADLVSLQESIDTSTPAGRLFYTMIAAMAQWEREEIVDRINASIPIRAKLGKPVGGHAVLGYKWENKEYVVDEKEAPVRKLIYEQFLNFKRKKTTAAWLNEKGYRTREGCEFLGRTVERLLRAPDAKGMRRVLHTKNNEKGNPVLKPESEWLHIPCEPLVSEELWNECNRILDQNKRPKRQAGPRAVYLLAGFIHCNCGHKMYIYHASPTYFCKNCKNKIAENDINEIFHNQLKTFLLTDTDLADYMQTTDSKVKEKEHLLEVLSNEIFVTRKRMKDLLTLRLDGEMNKETFMEHHKPLEERLVQLQDQLPELQAEVDFMKIQYLSSDIVLQDAKDLYDRWNDLSFEEKRNIVEIITDSITVGGEDISISLSYLPRKQNAGKKEHALQGVD